MAAEIQLIADPGPYHGDIAFANATAEFFSEVCALDQKRRTGRLSRKRARALVPTLRRRLKALCAVKLAHPKTLNLRDRLLSPERDAKKLFTFLTRPGMPPTNNHAERALRAPVLARKISFGSRSVAGASAFAVHASLLGTARRQNQPAIPFLYTLFTANTAAAHAALYANSS
jgi:transposase